jgi:hypothetical protein
LAEPFTGPIASFLEEPASFISNLSDEEETFADRNPVVICLTDDRDLYLGKEFIGKPDDTRELEIKLAGTFARCERELMEAQPKDLSRRILNGCCYRTVYIKAMRTSSYGDISKLAEAARKTGAQHVLRVADDRKKVTANTRLD